MAAEQDHQTDHPIDSECQGLRIPETPASPEGPSCKYDRRGVKRRVELVGGTWGQVPLEHRFELVEKALFRSQQKSDESGDSFIARVDVIWTELLAKEMTLDQLQAVACRLRTKREFW